MHISLDSLTPVLTHSTTDPFRAHCPAVRCPLVEVPLELPHMMLQAHVACI